MCKLKMFEECPLRRQLLPWAMRFTNSEELQIKLVETTLAETFKSLDAMEENVGIDAEMFATMRRVALEEFCIPYQVSDDENISSAARP